MFEMTDFGCVCVLRPSGRWLVSAANPRTREDSSAVGPGEEEAFQTVTAPTGILLKNHPRVLVKHEVYLLKF